MAGQITHMKVAYELMEPLGITEGKEQYILGSVAPDSVHFGDDYLKKKVHSHIFENCGPWGDTQDYDQWIENIRAFAEKYLVSETDRDMKNFLLGIVVHCLTDYWNDLLIWRALQKKWVPPMTNDGFKGFFAPETTRNDRWLFQNIDNAKEIMALLQESKDIGFEDFLRVEEIKKMKHHLIYEQYSQKEPIDVSGNKVFPADMILWFVEEVPQRIMAQLKELV